MSYVSNVTNLNSENSVQVVSTVLSPSLMVSFLNVCLCTSQWCWVKSCWSPGKRLSVFLDCCWPITSIFTVYSTIIIAWGHLSLVWIWIAANWFYQSIVQGQWSSKNKHHRDGSEWQKASLEPHISAVWLWANWFHLSVCQWQMLEALKVQAPREAYHGDRKQLQLARGLRSH